MIFDCEGSRVGRIVEHLRSLPEDDLEDLIRLLHKLHGILERGSV